MPHVILYGRLQSVITRTLWIAFLFGTSLYGTVAPNPFLRPGSDRKPPPVVKPVFKPKNIVRPNVAQEVEFKGYFILKGQAYFSIYNKKVNHGEWISINEKTYEEFMAQEFNLETETLTILYENQSFKLNLIQSKSGSGLPSSNKKPSSLTKLSTSPVKPRFPQFMPPKPKNTPTIPTWLTSRNTNNSPSRAPNKSLSLNNNRSTSPTLPRLPYPGTVPRRTSTLNSNPSTSPFAQSNPSIGQETQQSNPTTSPLVNNNSIQSTPIVDIQSEENSNTNNLNNEIDLDNLPPPPPPPNILPPSPPPNLLPSRE